MAKLSLVTAGACGLMLWAPWANAQSARTHDGLYLRLGAGLGYLTDSAESDPLPFVGGNVKASYHGFGALGQIGVGGTVTRGLVVGGRWLAEVLPDPAATDLTWRNTSPEDIDFDASTFHLLAPFVDYYFDPKAGLHLEGSIGFAILAVADGKGVQTGAAVQSQTATGIGFSAGIGNEWWLSDGWSAGILGEICLASVSGKSDIGAANDVDWAHLVVAPSLSFSVTMN